MMKINKRKTDVLRSFFICVKECFEAKKIGLIETKRSGYTFTPKIYSRVLTGFFLTCLKAFFIRERNDDLDLCFSPWIKALKHC